MGKLTGKVILVVEDNHLTAMVLSQAMDDAGGTGAVCTTVQAAMELIAQGKCSGAILDNAICHAHPEVCETLKSMGIPYVLHEDLVEVQGVTGARDPATADSGRQACRSVGAKLNGRRGV